MNPLDRLTIAWGKSGELALEAIKWFTERTNGRRDLSTSELQTLRREAIMASTIKPGQDSMLGRQKWMRVDLEMLRMEFQGTKRIADVAERLITMQSDPFFFKFCWTNSGDWESTTKIEEVLYCRHMSCYEFVHLCGWLAGPQITHATEGYTFLSAAKSAIVVGSSLGKKVAPAGTKPARNTIVFAKNFFGGSEANSAGYIHVGISLGGGSIAQLCGGWSQAHIDPLDSVFGKTYYEVQSGDYDYSLITFEYRPGTVDDE